MGDDAGHGVGQCLVHVDGGTTIAYHRIDKFMCQKRMRPVVTALVPKWFGKQIGGPPLRWIVLLAFGGVLHVASIILGSLSPPANDGSRLAWSLADIEAHL